MPSTSSTSHAKHTAAPAATSESDTSQQTLAIIKPDALPEHEGAILLAIEAAGFVIINRAKLLLSKYQAYDFYAEHKGKPFYEALCTFMSSGPVLVMALARHDAIAQWRALLGPTDSNKARVSAPESIRARFGTDGQRNACHGSDSVASAEREIAFFFPNVYADGAPHEHNVREFLEVSVYPLLGKGLVALCTEKPQNPAEWLGRWLLANNPRRPVVTVAEDARAMAAASASAASADSSDGAPATASASN